MFDLLENEHNNAKWVQQLNYEYKDLQKLLNKNIKHEESNIFTHVE